MASNSHGQVSQLSSALRQVSLSPSARGPAQGQGQPAQGQPQGQPQGRITDIFNRFPTQGLTLFSHRSAPNGFKVAVVLCELGYDYSTVFLDFAANEQRSAEYLSINPNSRVPTLIDHSPTLLNENSIPISNSAEQEDYHSVWESGAILLYLVDKYEYDHHAPCPLWSTNPLIKSQITSWLFFQTSGHAPMIGQALHFKYFHVEHVDSALSRYIEEVRRVYGVLEMTLAEKRESLILSLDIENSTSFQNGSMSWKESRYYDVPIWLACDYITIADLSFVPWNNVIEKLGIILKDEFPECWKWNKEMMNRVGVRRALNPSSI